MQQFANRPAKIFPDQTDDSATLRITKLRHGGIQILIGDA